MKTDRMVRLAAFAVAGAFWAVGEYAYSMSLKPSRHSKDNPELFSNPTRESRQLLIEARGWLTAQPGYYETSNTSRDGLPLFARVLSSPAHRWVICVHGYGDTSLSMALYARHYREAGWNVLLPDLRGHGRSGGDYVGMGYMDRLDILDWVNWLISFDPQAEIVLHGISMGAWAVLMAASEKGLPESVKAVVSDSAFTSMEAMLTHLTDHGKKLNLPVSLPFPFILYALDAVARVRAGYSVLKVSPVKWIVNCGVPVLLIHGTDDHYAPFRMLGELFTAAPFPKRQLLVEGARHVESVTTNPTLYWGTVDSFLAPYLINE